MAKLNVITDASGKLVAAVRAEPVKTKDGKNLEFRPHPDYKHHVIEVDESILKGPASELGKMLRAKAMAG
ncbi:MAG TPA: hypothetical protein VFA90_15725 [Terriglobales bacterium]|nr:hypothetical protein [Terriglobales bacterium]